MHLRAQARYEVSKRHSKGLAVNLFTRVTVGESVGNNVSNRLCEEFALLHNSDIL